MQTLHFQNDSSYIKSGLIFQNQFNGTASDNLQHQDLCAAVRAWASRDGQLTVADEVRKEWERTGEYGLNVPSNSEVWKVKFFRWLDNREDSQKYRKYIEKLAPAILSALPTEFRCRLVAQDNKMILLAVAEKEVSEVKQAVMLDAPTHQVVKEGHEALASILNLLPVDSWGPVLAGLMNMVPGVL